MNWTTTKVLKFVISQTLETIGVVRAVSAIRTALFVSARESIGKFGFRTNNGKESCEFLLI